MIFIVLIIMNLRHAHAVFGYPADGGLDFSVTATYLSTNCPASICVTICTPTDTRT